MVLFLFVIMLVNLERSLKEEQFNKQWIVGSAVAVLFGVLLLMIYRNGAASFPKALAVLPEASNTQDVGVMLYRNYMLPFEVASLLLLVAIVGAVVMAKKRI